MGEGRLPRALILGEDYHCPSGHGDPNRVLEKFQLAREIGTVHATDQDDPAHTLVRHCPQVTVDVVEHELGCLAGWCGSW
jgi:hypothetical protein